MLIVGASRGLGEAVAAHYASSGARILCVARTSCAHGTWVRADVATQAGIDRVVAAAGGEPLDVLLYIGGIWEDGAFTSAYAFERSPMAEIDQVLRVNLEAPIKLVRGLVPNLALSPDPRVVLIGSTGGLDNRAGPEVAYAASKFGLRGAAQALRQALAASRIAVGVINPGGLATPETAADAAPRPLIPLGDVITVIDCALSLSPAAVAAEINLLERDAS